MSTDYKNRISQYLKEDKNPNQKLDWTDDDQRYCKKHKRNFHFKCRDCFPIQKT